MSKESHIKKGLLQVGDLIHWTRDGSEAVAVVVEVDEKNGYKVFWNDKYVQWLNDWVLTEPPLGIAGNWRIVARSCHKKASRTK